MLDYAFSFLKKNIFLIESSFINRSYIFTTMGGSKNISPAQKEKKQQRGSDTKKGKKDSKRILFNETFCKFPIFFCSSLFFFLINKK